MKSGRILNKLLAKTHSPFQLVGGILGTFMGVLFILIAIQFYFEYLNLTTIPKNKFGKEYVIINKKVSGLNTLSGKVSAFKEYELDLLKAIPSVSNIGFFSVNKYSIMANLSLSGKETGIRTELFFEAVDDRFLDIVPDQWNWKEGDQIVPMILPADFINLYNFTFAPAKDLPLISPNTIKLVDFDLSLSGDNGRLKYSGQVVGYSHRINSILVPESFLRYTNSVLTSEQDIQKKFRIIVELDQSKSAALLKVINSKGWETNESKLLSGKFALFLEVTLLVVMVLGILTLFVAFFSTILYVLLSMNKAKYEIDTLMILGVPSAKIINWYAGRIAVIYGFILLFSLGLTFIMKGLLSGYISTFGLTLTNGLHLITVLSAVISLSVLWLIQYLRIKKI